MYKNIRKREKRRKWRGASLTSNHDFSQFFCAACNLEARFWNQGINL